MEDGVLVFFTVEEAAVGRRRKRDEWQYRVERRACFGAPGEVATVRLPGCERPARFHLLQGKRQGRAWTDETLEAYLSRLPVGEENGRIYYVYDHAARALLKRREEPLPLPWILTLTALEAPPEALVILWDRELDVCELVRHFVRVTRYIGVAAPQQEAWGELAEELAEEYGFLLDTAAGAEGLFLPPTGKIMVIGGTRCYDAARAFAGREVVWIETDTAGKSGRKICARIRHSRYVSVEKLLENR